MIHEEKSIYLNTDKSMKNVVEHDDTWYRLRSILDDYYKNMAENDQLKRCVEACADKAANERLLHKINNLGSDYKAIAVKNIIAFFQIEEK